MNTPGKIPAEFMQKAIENAIKDMVEDEFKAGLERVIQSIERKKGEIVAGVLVDIMKQVDFESHTDRIVITIRKP